MYMLDLIYIYISLIYIILYIYIYIYISTHLFKVKSHVDRCRFNFTLIKKKLYELIHCFVVNDISVEHIVECNPGIAEVGYDGVGSHVIGKKLQEREL